MTPTDYVYCNLIKTILQNGDLIPGRNGETRRLFALPSLSFTKTPLVTVRKTAWKKAIREMEWFLSGNPKCPDELLDWWQNQLNPDGEYIAGYGEQLRAYMFTFDQIESLIEGLLTHPYSRRHVITTWNPAEMADITNLNDNPLTPTTCHTTIAQFFVTPPGALSMHSYQRSADMLLGVPHNWIQSWALLMWVAAQTDTVVDKLLWTFGDAHIYMEESHKATANQLADLAEEVNSVKSDNLPRLIYPNKTGPFETNDFEVIGDVPAPLIMIRPKLL